MNYLPKTKPNKLPKAKSNPTAAPYPTGKTN
jgi:hypothetical protein